VSRNTLALRGMFGSTVSVYYDTERLTYVCENCPLNGGADHDYVTPREMTDHLAKHVDDTVPDATLHTLEADEAFAPHEEES